MDIMELGAIGELVGGVAVIATLIYLALQVKQGNRQSQDEAAKEVADRFDRFLETLSVDAHQRELWIAITGGGARTLELRNPQNLDDDDLTLMAIILYRAFTHFHNHYRAWITGGLETSQWNNILPFIHFHLASDVAQDWWQASKDNWFEDGFTAFIDQQIEALFASEARP